MRDHVVLDDLLDAGLLLGREGRGGLGAACASAGGTARRRVPRAPEPAASGSSGIILILRGEPARRRAPAVDEVGCASSRRPVQSRAISGSTWPTPGTGGSRMRGAKADMRMASGSRDRAGSSHRTQAARARLRADEAHDDADRPGAARRRRTLHRHGGPVAGGRHRGEGRQTSCTWSSASRARPPRVAAREAAKRAIDAGRIGYTPALGLPGLRERIARHYRGRLRRQRRSASGSRSPPAPRPASSSPSSPVSTPGDRVAIASPGYPAYRNILAALGLEPALDRDRPGRPLRITPAASCAAHRAKSSRACW